MTCITTHIDCLQRPKAFYPTTIIGRLECHTPQHRSAPSCISCSCNCPMYNALASMMSVVRHTAGPQEYDAQVIPHRDVSLDYGAALQLSLCFPCLWIRSSFTCAELTLQKPSRCANGFRRRPCRCQDESGKKERQSAMLHVK